ncbi:MAG: hypothetical protein H7X97_03885 [Opitutaceae bacterium]|nr:hypothetical protein [Verrucomicrobiales bacterium]
MFALPVIERELRVQSRRTSTVWLRVVAGALAALTTASTLSWVQGVAPGQAGRMLFISLCIVAYLFCLLEGVRQTSDTLSQEKRDGTLGLLFLTDLSGVDIVVGKLAATSLGAVYGLLAVFPAMAVVFPAGGVTAGEFWRTQLVLLNTLFLSLACGLWASARYREAKHALLSGLALAFGISMAPVLLELLLRGNLIPSASPVVAMFLARDVGYAANPMRFWFSLAAAHAVGWVLLFLAGKALAHSWRDEADANSVLFEPQSSRLDLGDDLTPDGMRPNDRAILETDPAFWLAGHSAQYRNLLPMAVLIMIFGPVFATAIFSRVTPRMVIGMSNPVSLAIELAPLLVIAAIAYRPLAEARRSGALELLLATPLTPQSIVAGQWRHFWQQKHGTIKAGLYFLTIVFVLAVANSVLNSTRGISFWYHAIWLLSAAQRLCCAMAALWLGLYLGMRIRSAVMATGWILLCCFLAPWMTGSIFWLIVQATIPGQVFGQSAAWYTVIVLGKVAIGFGYLLWLIYWSRRQLLTRFRELAVGT